MAKLFETLTAENWRKGYFSRWGKVGCLVFHLARIPGSDGKMTQDLLAAAGLLYPDRMESARATKSGWARLGCFNDHPDTTLEDVLRVLKCADV